jgi:hypothetical protein
MPYRKGISANEKNVVIWIAPVEEISVIASQRVGAERRPMTGSAKQSSFPGKKLDCFVASAPLRKRFAFVAGNDGGECGIYTPNTSFCILPP